MITNKLIRKEDYFKAFFNLCQDKCKGGLFIYDKAFNEKFPYVEEYSRVTREMRDSKQ